MKVSFSSFARASAGPSVGIIGAGPGGLALGIFLRKAGFRDFTIFDREDGVGGTWRINTYPGLACDVKSHLYSFSFDLNANWSRLWSGQPEILAYFEGCAERYRLGPHLRLGTDVVSARWDEATTTWRLGTSDGDEHTFDVVVSAVGLFTRPSMPTLLEKEPFTGTVAVGVRPCAAREEVLSNPTVAGTGRISQYWRPIRERSRRGTCRCSQG
jgi:cyclohexanone monooxygenase